MKRVLAFFIACFMVFSLCGCFNSSVWVVSKKTNTDGSFSAYEYGSDGTWMKVTDFGESGTELRRTDYSFADGKISSATTYVEGSVNGTENYYYNNGVIDSYALYNADGRLEKKVKYKTNDKGKLTLQTTITEDGVLYYKWEYDAKGRSVSAGACDKDGNYISHVIKSEYSGNNLSLQRIVLSDGTTDDSCYSVAYEHDKNGNTLLEKITQSYSGREYLMENAYTYDEHNHVLSAKSTIEGEVNENYTYKYDYDKNGNMQREAQQDSEGNVLYENSYEYVKTKFPWYEHPEKFI